MSQDRQDNDISTNSANIEPIQKNYSTTLVKNSLSVIIRFSPVDTSDLSRQIQLPQRRSQLYREIFKLQLGDRPLVKQIAMCLEADISQKILQKLALFMVQNNQPEIEEDLLNNQLQLIINQLTENKVLDEVVDINLFITQIVDVSELLVKKDANYEFAHLSFQSYLASKEIIETKQDNLLINNWDKSWWRETILLYSTQVNPNNLITHLVNLDNQDAFQLAKLIIHESGINISLEELKISQEQNIIENFLKYNDSQFTVQENLIEITDIYGQFQLSNYLPIILLVYNQSNYKKLEKLTDIICEPFKNDKYRVTIVIYKEKLKNSDIDIISNLRINHQIIIIPIPFVAVKQSIVQKEKAKHLLSNYVKLYISDSNIFDDRMAIYDTLNFFGRSHLLLQLEKDLTNLNSVGIFGLRKSGKTSIILQLHLSMLDYPFIHIDFQIYSGKIYYGADIFKRILEELLILLHSKTSYEQKFEVEIFDSGKPAKEFTTHFREQIIKMSEALFEVGYKKSIICCFDEIERILPNENDNPEEARKRIEEFNSLFGTLRALNQEKGLISLLVADLHPDCNRINHWHILGVPTNPLYKFFKEIFLEPFHLEDTEMMIRQIGELMGVEFKENLMNITHRSKTKRLNLMTK